METSKTNGANAPKKSGKLKWFLLGLGLLAAGGFSYFQWDKTKKKEKKKKEDPFREPTTKEPTKKQAAGPKKTNTTKPKPPPVKAPKKTGATSKLFPLKKGAKNNYVKQFQEALIKQNGKSILPKWGADGIYGEELANAIKKVSKYNNRNGEVITEDYYNDIVRPNDFIAERIASRLRHAITNTKNFDSAMQWLKTIKDKTAYLAVNQSGFENTSTNGSIQTLRQALFNTFKEFSQQQILTAQFLRIGFKYDGKKWALSGAGFKELIITTQETKVWKDSKNSVPVPANMVLGEKITQRGEFTLFENDKQHFLVESKSIKPYQTN